MAEYIRMRLRCGFGIQFSLNQNIKFVNCVRVCACSLEIQCKRPAKFNIPMLTTKRRRIMRSLSVGALRMDFCSLKLQYPISFLSPVHSTMPESHRFVWWISSDKFLIYINWTALLSFRQTIHSNNSLFDIQKMFSKMFHICLWCVERMGASNAPFYKFSETLQCFILFSPLACLHSSVYILYAIRHIHI